MMHFILFMKPTSVAPKHAYANLTTALYIKLAQAFVFLCFSCLHLMQGIHSQGRYKNSHFYPKMGRTYLLQAHRNKSPSQKSSQQGKMELTFFHPWVFHSFCKCMGETPTHQASPGFGACTCSLGSPYQC